MEKNGGDKIIDGKMVDGQDQFFGDKNGGQTKIVGTKLSVTKTVDRKNGRGKTIRDKNGQK